jgi:hypothetical protein
VLQVINTKGHAAAHTTPQLLLPLPLLSCLLLSLLLLLLLLLCCYSLSARAAMIPEHCPTSRRWSMAMTRHPAAPQQLQHSLSRQLMLEVIADAL